MSPQSRGLRLTLVLVAVVGSVSGCVRLGFDQPCATVDCGGHGTCHVTSDGEARCTCDTGYHRLDARHCARDLPQELLSGCADSTLEDVSYACAPTVDPGDAPDLHRWATDSGHTCNWAVVDPQSGTLSGVPRDDDVGSCTLAIVGDPGSDQPRQASLTVTVVNVRPTLVIGTALPVDQDSGPTVVCPDAAVQASDEGYGVYSLQSPVGQPPCADNGTLAIDQKNGAITLAPAKGFNGRCAVRVLFDDQNTVDSQVEAEVEVQVQPLAGFLSGTSAMDESGTYHLITINLSGPALQTVTVPLSVSGTADPTEYSLSGGSVSIAAGEIRADLQLEVTDDLDPEQDETLVVSLQTPTGAGLASTTVHTVTIQDNDLPPLTDVVSIHAGQYSVCVQQQDGTVRCWGHNQYGQLGTGDTVGTNTPVVAKELGKGCSNLSLGYYHACATFGGAAKCWGRNANGRLGDGTTTDRLTPVAVTGLGSGVTSIGAGEMHSCAVVNGAAKCWGANNYGQLGDGTTTQSTSPVQVQGLAANVKKIAVGNSHTCAVLGDGSVRCWGLNTRSQLGNNDNVNQSVPVTPTGLGAGAGATDLSLGYDHTCVLLSTGGLKCWGWSTLGQIGTGTGNKQVPTDVSGLTSGVKRVSIKGQTWGGGASCALTQAGGVKCWGTNTEGQIGDGTLICRTTPTDVSGLTSGVIDIARTVHTSCAVLAGGTVRCWGTNMFHTLGNNKLPQHFSFPIQLEGLGPGSAMGIGVGGRMMFVQKSDGSLYAAGNNAFGQLGVGDLDYRTSLTVLAGLQGSQTQMPIGAGTEHGCAELDGGMWCWGRNQTGEIGIGNKTVQQSPVVVPAFSVGVREIATGDFHSCAAPETGGVYCWGWNYLAAVGDGTTQVMSVTLPTPVVGIDPTKVVDRIFAGYSHTCVVYPSGALKCWGWNSKGQLGDGTTTTAPSAIDLLSSGVVAGAAGYEHTCVLMSTGTVKCCGDNSYGQLGDGTNQKRTTLVDVVGLNDVVALAAGYYATCALTKAGAVWCWGSNGPGTVGDQTFTDRNQPTAVTGLDTGVTAISLREQACALLKDGSVRCWGSNSDGAFGNGLMDHHVTPVTITAAP